MRRPITRAGLVIAALVAAFVVAAGVPGCQQLFTTSLATPLARSSVSLPSNLTPQQASDLMEKAKENGDDKLATALVGALVDQVGADPAAHPELAAAAAGAAVVASGTSDALMQSLSDFMDGGTPDASDLLSTILEGASADVVQALSYLESIPTATAEAGGLGVTDYVIAAVVIAARGLDSVGVTDPSTDDLSAFLGTAEYGIAFAILEDARSLVEAGSSSADMLDQLSAMMGL